MLNVTCALAARTTRLTSMITSTLNSVDHTHSESVTASYDRSLTYDLLMLGRRYVYALTFL